MNILNIFKLMGNKMYQSIVQFYISQAIYTTKFNLFFSYKQKYKY